MTLLSYRLPQDPLHIIQGFSEVSSPGIGNKHPAVPLQHLATLSVNSNHKYNSSINSTNNNLRRRIPPPST
jgi:hypothetical protein